MAIRSTDEKLDRMLRSLQAMRTSHAVLEAHAAEMARALREIRRDMVTRDTCAARHRPLNGRLDSDRADRRVRWSLYAMGAGTAVSASLSIVNLLVH